MSRDVKTRREVLKLTAGAAAIPAYAMFFRSNPALAQDMPHLAEDDPTAMALGYVHDATTSKNARYAAGQHCANCVQIQGEDGAEWRPCPLFPGKTVAAAGWCSVWVQKPV
jgi:hypothetical protein